MSVATPYSSAEFRRRALRQNGGPAETAWREHGDHLINPTVHDIVLGLKLKDAAVLVPVVDRGEEARVIFTQRTSKLRKHSGQIAFPGGGIDPEDASPEQAALREAEEEIGLSRDHVEVVARLPHYLSLTGFRITPVLSVVRPGFALALNPDEVDEVFEVPLSWLMDPGHHQRGTRPFAGADRFYYRMPYQGRDIWGITASIVRTIYERLYA